MDEHKGNGHGSSDTTASLQAMSLGELKQEYRDRFGKAPALADKRKLVRALSRQATETAIEIAVAEPSVTDQPISSRTPRNRGRRRADAVNNTKVIEGPSSKASARLAPGVVLTRLYKGRRLRVLVRGPRDFEFEGRHYKSLSALACEISKSHCSGFRFFGLTAAKPKAKKAASR